MLESLRLILLLLLLAITIVRGNYQVYSLWKDKKWLKEQGKYPYHCSDIKGLTLEQRSLCLRFPGFFPVINTGIDKALDQCQEQMKWKVWNCTGNLYDRVLNRGLAETAYLQSLISASVMISLTLSCSHGNLTGCSCIPMTNFLSKNDLNHQNKRNVVFEKYSWNGCHHNANFGYTVSKHFIDSEQNRIWSAHKNVPNTGFYQRLKMNPRSITANKSLFRKSLKLWTALHNFEIGRQAVLSLQMEHCKCHGTSGSCMARTCWKQLPKLNKVANALKNVYENQKDTITRGLQNKIYKSFLQGSQYPLVKIKYQQIPQAYQITFQRDSQDVQKESDLSTLSLLYLTRSPDFCQLTDKYGILHSNRGRECNVDDREEGHCEELCCRRGFSETLINEIEQCECQFIWCCKLVCKTCNRTRKAYICN